VRDELGIAPDVLLVGSVGNVRPAKDYQTLLRTAHRVKAVVGPKVKFVVAGQRTRPLFDELESLQRELQVEDTVEFLGFRDDVPDLLRALDLVLLSSAHEGFSLVAVQAMATGLPVVSTRCGGPEEIFTHEEEGLFCPPGDPEALADAILRLREDPILRRSMGEKGRETAEKRFSQDAMVNAYEDLYRTVLGRPRGRGQQARSTPGRFQL
jgi:glycosyltransferase involved in cell wall biosynthesis